MRHFRKTVAAMTMGLTVLCTAGMPANAATAIGIATTVSDMMFAKRDRSGEYRVAKRRRKKIGKAVGIAVGVAAAAIILNEAAKAERRRKKRARRRSHCHHKVRVHSHARIDGRGPHRHNNNCHAYVVYPRDDDVVVAPPPQPRCDRGFEYIDGKCYRNEELDDRPGDDRRASVDEDAAYDRCAARYRSFRYEDGTFQPYGGRPRRLCPYLE